jgi:DNA (cytosine-5)-methyltransferase 1
VVVRWAEAIAPTVLIVENVPEFRTWGPLDESGQPDRSKKGETFTAWVQALEALGYQVEHRVLAACDHDTPTTRKRLFVVARRDGQAVHWPEPTNGPGRAKPFRTAAECIDWSIPCPSIFTRKKDLAEATQRRIAEGIRRYVLEAASPYIVQTSHQSNDGGKVKALSEPLSTVVTKAEHLLVVPTILNTRNGERKGQAPRVRDVMRPLPTITAQGSQGALCAAFLAKHNRGAVGQSLEGPVHTITGKDTKAFVAAHMTKFYGTAKHGTPMDQPLPTVTAGGGKGGGHMGLVAALLIKYYGAGGQHQSLEEPLHTIVSKARFGLVTVDIGGEEYAVTDIGMRMLQPRELARAQGFPDSYQLIGTKTQQVARIGNSVCPPLAQALVEAQFGGSGCPDLPALGDQVPLFGHRFEAAAK